MGQTGFLESKGSHPECYLNAKEASLGFFEMCDHFNPTEHFFTEHLDAGLLIKILSGITTGILCVSVGQPTDVVKIRLQAQGATGHKEYSGSVHAYSDIAKTEGIRGLWKGNCYVFIENF